MTFMKTPRLNMIFANSLVLFVLATALLGCATTGGPTVALPPAELYKKLDVPTLPEGNITNKDLVDHILALRDALGLRDIDRAAIEEWVKGIQTK